MTKILCRTLAYSRSWKNKKIPQAGSSRKCVRLMYYKLEAMSCGIQTKALCEREKGITTLLCFYNYFICLDPQCVGSCKIHLICMIKIRDNYEVSVCSLLEKFAFSMAIFIMWGKKR